MSVLHTSLIAYYVARRRTGDESGKVDTEESLTAEIAKNMEHDGHYHFHAIEHHLHAKGYAVDVIVPHGVSRQDESGNDEGENKQWS